MRRMPLAASARRQAERLCDVLGDRAPRGGFVELHLAAEEALGGEPAEHQVGVGDRRPRAAEAVAGRAGIGAGALRPDAQRAAASTAAMLPPPVPTSEMCTIGIWIGSASL